VLAFCLKELAAGIEIFITIPDGYECIHFKNGAVTSSITSNRAHLTYHGHTKRKKISGEIILATYEYKNSNHDVDKLICFHTKDYFRNLGARRVVAWEHGFFIDKYHNGKPLPDGWKRMSALLS
jgi:hypothetical protein